jgi:hypothetical protein
MPLSLALLVPAGGLYGYIKTGSTPSVSPTLGSSASCTSDLGNQQGPACPSTLPHRSVAAHRGLGIWCSLRRVGYGARALLLSAVATRCGNPCSPCHATTLCKNFPLMWTLPQHTLYRTWTAFRGMLWAAQLVASSVQVRCLAGRRRRGVLGAGRYGALLCGCGERGVLLPRRPTAPFPAPAQQPVDADPAELGISIRFDLVPRISTGGVPAVHVFVSHMSGTSASSLGATGNGPAVRTVGMAEVTPKAQRFGCDMRQRWQNTRPTSPRRRTASATATSACRAPLAPTQLRDGSHGSTMATARGFAGPAFLASSARATSAWMTGKASAAPRRASPPPRKVEGLKAQERPNPRTVGAVTPFSAHGQEAVQRKLFEACAGAHRALLRGLAFAVGQRERALSLIYALFALFHTQ